MVGPGAALERRKGQGHRRGRETGDQDVRGQGAALLPGPRSATVGERLEHLDRVRRRRCDSLRLLPRDADQPGEDHPQIDGERCAALLGPLGQSGASIRPPEPKVAGSNLAWRAEGFEGGRRGKRRRLFVRARSSRSVARRRFRAPSALGGRVEREAGDFVHAVDLSSAAHDAGEPDQAVPAVRFERLHVVVEVEVGAGAQHGVIEEKR